MAKKSIVWSQRANFELKEVLNYYLARNQNPEYSLKILNELEALLNQLAQNVFLGRKTSNNKTRVIVMNVYLVFYEINNQQIEILSFWDNRQESSKRVDH